MHINYIRLSKALAYVRKFAYKLLHKDIVFIIIIIIDLTHSSATTKVYYAWTPWQMLLIRHVATNFIWVVCRFICAACITHKNMCGSDKTVYICLKGNIWVKLNYETYISTHELLRIYADKSSWYIQYKIYTKYLHSHNRRFFLMHNAC